MYIGEGEVRVLLTMLSRKYLVLISVPGTLRWDHLFAVFIHIPMKSLTCICGRTGK
jgi:hypothetical protein